MWCTLVALLPFSPFHLFNTGNPLDILACKGIKASSPSSSKKRLCLVVRHNDESGEHHAILELPATMQADSCEHGTSRSPSTAAGTPVKPHEIFAPTLDREAV